jgi:two-component system, OmpR family, response regulator
MTARILVAEDDPDIGALLRIQVAECAAEVRVETDGKRALLVAQQGKWDLLILDWRLPGLDGVTLCRQLRAHRYTQPILLLTARVSEADRVAGLDAGADDYVTKPFGAAELKARIRAQLRRAQLLRFAAKEEPPAASRCGAIHIDRVARIASIDGRVLTLTPREFDLLTHFVLHPSSVFTRQQLLEAVWGTGFDGYEYTVNSHINRLRAKIERDPANPVHIVTVWGIGYRLDAAS